MNVLGIAKLVWELLPEFMKAGGAALDLWDKARDIIANAGNNGGKVDPDAERQLRALVQVHLDTLAAYAAEARDNEMDPA